MPPTLEPPLPILSALHLVRSALGRGQDERWKIATVENGYVEIRWLNREGCYRFTLDFALRDSDAPLTPSDDDRKD